MIGRARLTLEPLEARETPATAGVWKSENGGRS
jgi:hypothetical protein